MKILYLSFYFEPDLCAGSFRNTPLVEELSRLIDPNDTIHVVTTMPNRYQTFAETAHEYEQKGNIIIHRIKLPQHRSGFIDQALAFKTFFLKALKITGKQKYDLVFASSSRLFTAFLGSIISSKKEIPFYVDIRDIFVDTMQDVIKNFAIKYPLLTFLKIIENFTFKKANHINLISEGFKPYFSKYSKPSFSYFSNGIDEEFLSFQPSANFPNGKTIITYAGNIGEGQGMEKIVPEAAKLLGNQYHFRIIGDGGKKSELEKKIKDANITNVQLIPPTNRKNIIKYYQESHYLFLHLNNYKAFEKVLPSKIFEYGATDKPIIAGVSGYAANFISRNLSNYILFPPGNAGNMVTQIKNQQFTYQERKTFCEKYSRKKINQQMANSILKLAN
jgi:UDP-N-acetylglucosamine:LPS N-acetylglucosamine transferase